MQFRQFKLKHSTLALAAAAALGPFAATPASAAVCTWNTAAGNWAALANWAACVAGNGNPAGVPGAADTANIGAAGVVTINTTQTVGSLNNAGQINIDAFLLTLGSGSTTNSGTINVGSGVTAALQIGAGHNLNNTSGVINIGNGSVVNQFGSTITGGQINSTGTGRLVAGNNNNNFLDGVTLNGTLDLATGTGIQRVVNNLALNGTVNVNNNSVLSFNGNQTLGGIGTVVLGNTGGSNRALSLEGNTVLTIGSGVTVRGQNGTIGQAYLSGGVQSLVNDGRISADVAGGSISLAPSNGITNNGVLEALNGGTLVLNSSVIGNIGSSIAAGVGSTVLQNGVALSGVINTTGSGTFRASNANANFLSGVTLNGNLDLASGTGIERVTGGLVLNGIVNVNNNSVLSFNGDQTLSGNGTVVLGSTGPSNRALSLEGNTVLTIASGVTVRGQNGTIGQAYLAGGVQTIINNGLISADVAGGSFSLEPSAGTVNNGVLQALNGGTLVLNSSVIGNVGGSIAAGAGSTVLQNGVALSGVINTTGSGTFRAANSNANFLNGVTFNGTLDLASGTSIERVTGGLVLNGTVNVNNNSVLSFNGDQTLSGTGTVVLGATGSSNRALSLEGNTILTIGSGIVVRGENGTLGQAYLAGGTQTLVNNGRISADVLGGSFSLAPSNGTINNSVLEAQNGGTLVLNSNVVGTATGSIVAGAGSTVLQNGVTLSGVINSSGTGNFRAANSNANVLDGVTFNGPLDLASATSIERVINGLTLNGTINVNNNSVLSFNGNQTLGGNGTIVLGNTGPSNRALSLEANTVLTIGSGVTVRGQNGTVGQAYLSGGTQQITNNGSILADVGGGTVILTTALTQNNALLGAANGGTLRLDSAVTQSGAGQINAATGSTVLQNGITITGGALNTAGTGRVAVSNSNSNVLSGVTVNGLLDMASGTGIERVVGGLTLGSGATVSVNNNSVLSFVGDQTLGGTGTVLLGNTGPSNRALSLEGNTTLTVASGVTVRGTNGTIGQTYLSGGSQTIVNNGTINSDGGGTITVTPGALINNGLVRAQNGTMTIQAPLSGTGTLLVDAAGIMNLANGAKTQGILAMGAAGAALNLGTGNLTLSSDYTNVGAGTGNSFNRRAGVTGTGQIVAGGDVSQVITGAGVTNGATTNATLTVGNMRVGANTFNVQIGNAGTTGPTLRGAIQTSVNGGNISDARLSGTAVTASNYNAGAPGANSGNLGVTFTAASAGALAPLTGQAVNLRSNFENIADQRLNIVMGAGAAAYNAAVGSTVSPVQVANQRVGGSNSATLNISNTAAAGAFSEDLNASIASFSGQATPSGSISGRLAGTNNTGTGAIAATVDTTSAGAKTGVVTLNYQTAGTVGGVSNGLGTAAAGSQAVTVNGNVYQLAAGAIQTGALNFGTVQVGQSVSQGLVIRNTASGAAGFVEDLNAGFGATSGTGAGLISGSGSLSGILAGANSTAGNGSMVVSVNTGAAGSINGSILVNYSSAGAVGGVSNGLGTLGVGSEGYGVSGTIQATGNVINQANALVNNPTINLGAVRVGAAAPSGTVSVTNVASAPPQAALNAAFASTTGPATASGSFNLLNPGATNASSLTVGLNTGTAGNFTGGNAGTATINFVSDASNVGNCAPNCQLNLASQTVNVEGKVYTQAVGAASGTAINFGVVRVGDTVSAANITISNTAASTALNDTLRADLSGVGGAFSAPGSVAGVAAQSTAQLAVGLNTATAGVFSQTGALGFTSQNADMADVSAGANATVSLMAQVNNLANGDFDLQSGSGTLSQTGTSYVLDLGTIVLGDTVSTALRLDNDVAGPADELSGLFDLAGADDFSYSGWNPLAFLAAGQASGTLNVNWLAGSLGLFSDTIVFNGFGTNASDPLGLVQTRQLTIRANVINAVPPGTVPEPGTLALLLGAAAAAGLARRKAALQGAAR